MIFVSITAQYPVFGEKSDANFWQRWRCVVVCRKNHPVWYWWLNEVTAHLIEIGAFADIGPMPPGPRPHRHLDRSRSPLETAGDRWLIDLEPDHWWGLPAPLSCPHCLDQWGHQWGHFRSNQTTIVNPIITYLVPTVPTTFLILFFLPLWRILYLILLTHWRYA